MRGNSCIYDFLFGSASRGRGGVAPRSLASLRLASARFVIAPNAPDLCRSRHTARCCFAPVLVITVRLLRLRLHHGGHFDADVFRHRRPRLPLVHHLPAVMFQLRAAEPHAPDEGFPCAASLVSGMSNGTETVPLPSLSFFSPWLFCSVLKCEKAK